MKYPDFVKTTGYCLPDGLSGFNCRHSFHPLDPNVDKPLYTKQKLNALNEKTVIAPGGNKIPVFQAMQEQRKLERDLRKLKREKAMLVSCNLDSAKINVDIRIRQYRLAKFCEATGLPRMYGRESINGR